LVFDSDFHAKKIRASENKMKIAENIVCKLNNPLFVYYCAVLVAYYLNESALVVGKI
jgi:hypothetical protein